MTHAMCKKHSTQLPPVAKWSIETLSLSARNEQDYTCNYMIILVTVACKMILIQTGNVKPILFFVFYPDVALLPFLCALQLVCKFLLNKAPAVLLNKAPCTSLNIQGDHRSNSPNHYCPMYKWQPEAQTFYPSGPQTVNPHFPGRTHTPKFPGPGQPDLHQQKVLTLFLSSLGFPCTG